MMKCPPKEGQYLRWWLALVALSQIALLTHAIAPQPPVFVTGGSATYTMGDAVPFQMDNADSTNNTCGGGAFICRFDIYWFDIYGVGQHDYVTSTNTNPVTVNHVFAYTGVVSYFATFSQFGLTSGASTPNRTITILPRPYGNCSFTTVEGLDWTVTGRPVNLYGIFTGGGSITPVVSYFWYLGAPVAANQRSLCYNVSQVCKGIPLTVTLDDLVGDATTSFDITLVIKNGEGGSSGGIVATRQLTVRPMPAGTIDFAHHNTTVTANETVVVHVTRCDFLPYSLNVSLESSPGVTIPNSIRTMTGGAGNPYAYLPYILSSSLVTGNTALIRAKLTIYDNLGSYSDLIFSPWITVTRLQTATVSFLPAESTVGASVTLSAALQWGTPPYSVVFSIVSLVGTIIDTTAPVGGVTSLAAASYSLSGNLLPSAADVSFMVVANVTDSVGAVASLTSATNLLVHPPGNVTASFSHTSATPLDTVQCQGTAIVGGTAPYNVTFYIVNPDFTPAALGRPTPISVGAAGGYSNYNFAQPTAPVSYVLAALLTDAVGVVRGPFYSGTVSIKPAPYGSVAFLTAFAGVHTVTIPLTISGTGFTGGLPFNVNVTVVLASNPSVTVSTVSTVVGVTGDISVPYTFTAPGSYLAKISMLNTYDVVNTAVSVTSLLVAALPSAALSFSPPVISAGLAATVVISSFAGGTGPYLYTWTIRQGTTVTSLQPVQTSTTTPPTFTLTVGAGNLVGNVATLFSVQLVITDALGAQSTAIIAGLTVNPSGSTPSPPSPPPEGIVVASPPGTLPYWIWIVIGVGALVILVVLIILLCFCRRREKCCFRKYVGAKRRCARCRCCKCCDRCCPKLCCDPTPEPFVPHKKADRLDGAPADVRLDDVRPQIGAEGPAKGAPLFSSLPRPQAASEPQGQAQISQDHSWVPDKPMDMPKRSIPAKPVDPPAPIRQSALPRRTNADLSSDSAMSNA